MASTSMCFETNPFNGGVQLEPDYTGPDYGRFTAY